MTKYDCVDCKRPVEILVPEENICTDCYIARLKLHILRLSAQANDFEEKIQKMQALIVSFDTMTLLKEVEHDKH